MSCPSVLAQDQASQWNGFQRGAFTVADRPCFITKPTAPASGRPWVWRISFPDYHAEVDLELLRSGWAVGYIECLDMLGCDAALALMDRFYEEMTTNRGMAAKPAFVAVSRGGLAAYRYAARHPERVACIYADVPVMSLTSWPLEAGEKGELAKALRHYGFRDEAALRGFHGNPLDLLGPIAKARIPLRHVISLDDAVVPPEQNTLEAERRLKKLGHAMEVITVKGGTPESQGHHFVLPQAAESARFIMRHTAKASSGIGGDPG